MPFLTLLSLLAAIAPSYQEIEVTVYTPKLLQNLPAVDFSLSTALESHIKFYLYSAANQTEWLELYHGNIKTLPVLPTKIFCHGYNMQTKSLWYASLKEAYFQKGAYNIIYIDWSLASNLKIYQAQANTRSVGDFIAKFLVQTNLNLDKIHLIGHSLGSHVSGFVGKAIFELTKGKKLGRITGLDPTGPGFKSLPANLRLSPDDALFVDVYHTEISLRGYAQPCGHVDFYPNGGKNQPGCEPPAKDAIHRCSHHRAIPYFTESVNKEVRAQKAVYSAENGLELDKDGGETVVFGDGIDQEARGVYYIKTRGEAPFLGDL